MCMHFYQNNYIKILLHKGDSGEVPKINQGFFPQMSDFLTGVSLLLLKVETGDWKYILASIWRGNRGLKSNLILNKSND